MIITKYLFDQIEKGEIFRVVVTRFQRMHKPIKMKLKFVCIKGHGTQEDWTIYAGKEDQHEEDIAAYGDKTFSEDIIRSICPCDDEVYRLYRY